MAVAAAAGQPIRHSTIPAYVVGPDRAPADHPDELRAADPANRVSAQTPPFLILHGDDDRIIEPAQTARLHQALRAAGVDSTRYVIPDAGDPLAPDPQRTAALEGDIGLRPGGIVVAGKQSLVLFDAYAHCADRRDAQGQTDLFTEDAGVP